MTNCRRPELVVTGIGVISAVGQGKSAFASALMQGHHAFDVMKRPGRQRDTAFLGAEIASLPSARRLSKRTLRTTSLSGQVAVAALEEAWDEAGLEEVDPGRVGLVIGGSNIQQRELVLTQEHYRNRPSYVRPTYGFTFLDSDLYGLCTELFGIKGYGLTVGAASASGQLAVLQACQAILAGQVDVCIALGALMDLSYWEFQALRSMGAMGSDRYGQAPASACRPFDSSRDGFIYGESCGAIVIERAAPGGRTGMKPYATLAGWAMRMDGNRNPNPSYEGEVWVIEEALRHAGLSAGDIDYVNPHGTGSVIGDETELAAIRDCGLSHAYINTTKSIVGHGLSAAGVVEVIATLLQMEARQLHPSRNLDDPIDRSVNWVKGDCQLHAIQHALKLSMGFGGINTALCVSAIR